LADTTVLDGNIVYNGGKPTVNNKTILTTEEVQTITGGKTFLGDIDFSQSWQDVTSSRSDGVTYTNNTGKPIFVSITFSNSAGATNDYSVYVGALKVGYAYKSTIAYIETRSFIVPAGSTYKTVKGGTGIGMTMWAELR